MFGTLIHEAPRADLLTQLMEVTEYSHRRELQVVASELARSILPTLSQQAPIFSR